MCLMLCETFSSNTHIYMHREHRSGIGWWEEWERAVVVVVVVLVSVQVSSVKVVVGASDVVTLLVDTHSRFPHFRSPYPLRNTTKYTHLTSGWRHHVLGCSHYRSPAEFGRGLRLEGGAIEPEVGRPKCCCDSLKFWWTGMETERPDGKFDIDYKQQTKHSTEHDDLYWLKSF